MKRWLLLRFFSQLWLSKSLLSNQLFALKTSLITFYMFFLSVKLDWNQAVGSTVIGGRDSKSHSQADYTHIIFMRKRIKKEFPHPSSWNCSHSMTLSLFPLHLPHHILIALLLWFLFLQNAACISLPSSSYFSLGNIFLILISLGVHSSVELLLLWGCSLESEASEEFFFKMGSLPKHIQCIQ